MASGNARGEDKRWEDALRDGERNRFNKCSVRGAVGIASVADDDGVGVARREEGEEAGRGKSVCARERTRENARERERNGVCRRSTSASATERQQTHACATWSERSSNSSSRSSWTRGATKVRIGGEKINLSKLKVGCCPKSKSR